MPEKEVRRTLVITGKPTTAVTVKTQQGRVKIGNKKGMSFSTLKSRLLPRNGKS